MSDDKRKRGEPDRSRIHLNEDYEVQYWTKELDISRERLEEIVNKVGNSADAVRRELSKAA